MQKTAPEIVRPHLKGKKTQLSQINHHLFFNPHRPLKTQRHWGTWHTQSDTLRDPRSVSTTSGSNQSRRWSPTQSTPRNSPRYLGYPPMEQFGIHKSQAVRCSQVQVLLMSTSRWKRLEVTNWTSSKTSESEPYWTPLLSNTETKTSPKNLWHFKLESPISKAKNPNFKLSFHPSHHFQPFPNPSCPPFRAHPSQDTKSRSDQWGFHGARALHMTSKDEITEFLQDQRLGVRWGRER